MAKKRSIVPFYGKREQRMEHEARFHMRANNLGMANQLFEAVHAGVRIRMFQNARMMAHRPIAAFMKVPRKIVSFLRNYREA